MSVSLSSGVREADLLGFVSGKTAADISPLSHAKASNLIDDAVPPPPPVDSSPEIDEKSAPESAEDPESSAAVKVQKVFRSYRARRKLADSAVEIEPDDRWWQAIEFARLNQRTISFFNFAKPESVSSRWNRIVSNASKVGKGLSKVANAQKLAFLHWIEAIDPRHRYGKSLQFYYEEWCNADSGQPFFYWLDIGDGKHLDLKQCPRSKLRSHSVKYLAPKERERYEYVFEEGKIVHKLSETPLTTTKDSMWIFVMSTCKKLYIGEKKKGMFHHSSFLAGGATLSAGWLEAEDGVLKFISPYSGHYRPSDDSFDVFLSILKENGVSLDAVAPLISSSLSPPAMSVSYSAVAPEADVLGFTSGGNMPDTGPKFIGDAVPENMEASAALKVQKVYRSYRTRRRLADSVVEPDALWWQAIEYAKLNHRTITFFDHSKPESPSSRWNRIVSNASKVGQGLSKDDNAQKLAFLHWIEAIDPRHRYGQSLQVYYEEWAKADSGQPFFYWLDVGDGKHIDLEKCPRSKLRQHSIKYLGPKEREHYEYVFVDGKVIHKLTGTPLTTNKDAVWIYVMSPSKKFYAGEKKKGVFQHSSFLAGGATLAAGWVEAEDGVFKVITPLSGHYRPGADVNARFLSMLIENGINLDEVKVNPAWSPNHNSMQKSES